MVVPRRRTSIRAALRLVVVASLCLGLGVTWSLTNSSSADEAGRVPVPAAVCGPGSLPETSIQGRVPASDYQSGRYLQGYRCNTEQVSHEGASGGFKTLRYTDSQGNVCAYYDSSALVPPTTTLMNL